MARDDEGSNSGGSSSEDEYVVERVVDKRTHRGKTEYLIKWKGWSHQDNTWEPVENLAHCPNLITEYEALYNDEPLASTSKSSPSKKSRGKDGKEVERIIGMVEIQGESTMLVKWDGVQEAELVPEKKMKAEFQQEVTNYMKWRKGD